MIKSCQTTIRGKTGFTLIELLVVISIIALLIGVLLPSLATARRGGRKAVCMSNQKQFGVGYSTYGADYKDKIATFSWAPGQQQSQWSELNVPGSISGTTGENIAAAAQATDIARRLSGRTDLVPPPTWTPHFFYSHLVMNDYLAQRLPEPMVVCPDDSRRIGLQKACTNLATAAPGTDPAWREAYSSSYSLVPSAYSADAGKGPWRTLGPGPTQGQFWLGSLPMGGRSLIEVSFPSQKVCMADVISRHEKTPQFYAYDTVIQPVLMFDFSVRDVTTGKSNPGADPNGNGSPAPLYITYQPDSTMGDPPTKSGQPSQRVLAHYGWTRMGLHGVDVGGGEVTR